MDDIARMTASALAAPRYKVPTGDLVGHARFDETLSAYATSFVGLYAGHTRLIKMVTSPARYLTIGFLMSLHAWRRSEDDASGATIGQIQTLAAAARIASPGRVNAILANFLAAGFVTAHKVVGDRRLRRLEPAAPLLDHRADWLRIYLTVIDRLYPGSNYSTLFRNDPDFGWEWQRQWMIRTIQMAATPEVNTDLIAFIARDGGHLLLMSLIADADVEGWSALPFAQGPSRFGLSRQHLVHFVTDLETAGLVRVDGEGGHRIRLAPEFVSRYRRMMATLFEATEHVCTRAVAARALPEPVLSNVA